MNQITLNLIAIGIFAVVLMILVGPLINLSPAIPATIGIGILVTAAVDTFGLQGAMGDLLIDAIAQQDPAYRHRIVHHEAGHFLVAHLLGISVTDYTLSAWDALQKGQRGRGGVNFNLDEMVQQADSGTLSAQSIDAYCTVWMAGVAAEQLKYGQAEGGGSDRAQVRLLWSRLKASNHCDTKIRWSILRAKTLIEQHSEAYIGLVEKMEDRETAQVCNDYLQCRVKQSDAEQNTMDKVA